ncbi:hypothetical protein PILCRDRAFT_17110 [Piloderma croceum F 1598]|uniref:Protein kinase domain-containing protein n=1 Tax=Piloderma croceum (strain F 1598) TaxID=765440 RepID=A0A0C3EU84_PILCF|nr:hypothetical protein PILCRDRAFT_17110 [Piloderma croceum F 1598]
MLYTPANPGSYDPDLGRYEYFWVDHQPFLLSCGYQLRPRYDPAWVPSWKHKDIHRYLCEDGNGLLKDNVLDATRVKDNVKVVLKRVFSDGDEIRIALYLSSVEMTSDPRNRTVPILDVISLPDDKYVLLVMPFLRIFNTPPFHCRDEVGLEFMHEHNISHGDACKLNLMMDASRVVPKGSHFIRDFGHDGVNCNLTWRHRCTVGPVQYFYIDFGLSMWHPHGYESAKALGIVGQVKDIPELSDTVPYNPFKLDICQLGRTILKVSKEYPDLHVFIPFAEHMAHPNSNDRPSATEALAEFEAIVLTLRRRRLRARIWRHEDTFFERLLCFFRRNPVL